MSSWHYCHRSFRRSNQLFKYKLQPDWQWKRRFMSNLFGAGINHLRRSGHPQLATVLSQCTRRATTSELAPHPSAATLAAHCPATSRSTRSPWWRPAAKVHRALSVRWERDNDDDTISGTARTMHSRWTRVPSHHRYYVLFYPFLQTTTSHHATQFLNRTYINQ